LMILKPGGPPKLGRQATGARLFKGVAEVNARKNRAMTIKVEGIVIKEEDVDVSVECEHLNDYE
jgi:hypothetical protein